MTLRKKRGHFFEEPWAQGVIAMLQRPAVVLDDSHRILGANKPFCDLVDATPDTVGGWTLHDVGNGLLNVPGLQQFLELVETGSAKADGYQLEVKKGLSAPRTFTLNAQYIPAKHSSRALVLAIEDTTRPTLGHRPGSMAALHMEQKSQGVLASIARANHDFRQPLQTLSLLQGVLAMREKDPGCHALVARLKEAIEALTGMLDALISAEQLSTRRMSPEIRTFPISSVINRLWAEMAYHAEARGLEFRVVQCSAAVRTDARLLGQVLRALFIEAAKLIRHGRVLLGCRRQDGKLVIQIWIRGTGVSADQQQVILDEFHGHDEASTGSNLADLLVRPLSDLLGLAVKVRSRSGNGLVFTADVPMDAQPAEAAFRPSETSKGAILVTSDDPFHRDALVLLLREIGHESITATADDGFASLVANKTGGIRPEIVIVDLKEPYEPTASKTVSSLRWMLGWMIPAIILVDDVSKGRSVDVINEPCVYLQKPIRPGELTGQIAQFLAEVRHRAAASNPRGSDTLRQTVFVVDDDGVLRDAVRDVLSLQGQRVELFSNSESFLEFYKRDQRGCLVIDNKLPGMNGVDLLERLKSEGSTLPSIMITGHGDTSSAVRALKAGAIDYIEKPISYEGLLSAVERALDVDRGSANTLVKKRELAARLVELTPRERQVMDLVVAGQSSKKIAQILAISQRTVENHRAAIMKRAGATSLPDLIRIVVQLRLSDDN